MSTKRKWFQIKNDHLDANKMYEKKARWKLHKDTMRCFKQILEAVPNKTTSVWPLTSDRINYPCKMKKTWEVLLEKQGRTYK